MAGILEKRGEGETDALLVIDDQNPARAVGLLPTFDVTFTHRSVLIAHR
jgi:hypothetical protein